MTEPHSNHGNGRVAVVTGATGIIGPMICEILQRDGWRVAGCATSSESFDYCEKLLGHELCVDRKCAAPLQGRDACHAIIQQIENNLGPVALLVNNAAANRMVPLAKLTEGDCQAVLDANLLAPLWLSQSAEKSLIAQQGVIINMSSVMAKTRPRRGAHRSARVAVGRIGFRRRRRAEH